MDMSRGARHELTPGLLKAQPVHNKVISGFQALRQARAPVAGLEPATEGSLQISGRTRKPLCYRRPYLHESYVTDSNTNTNNHLNGGRRRERCEEEEDEEEEKEVEEGRQEAEGRQEEKELQFTTWSPRISRQFAIY
ncbi:hypothetical protein PoB_006102000 [Plakobranchus ocellatus]|uniref:Uncharacterized protein n=1 Tax=Plakobranchus ocellatus TaxID=259542 RepID=A0AAV4CRG5_9GAST|nr:hypothetical protein PoB_006102000 [Plakobranchus ocellatus]